MAGIRELDAEYGRVLLIAGFEEDAHGGVLVQHFAAYEPCWRKEPETDWVAYTESSWPGRLTGKKFFLCPPWCQAETPQGGTAWCRIPDWLAERANTRVPN